MWNTQKSARICSLKACEQQRLDGHWLNILPLRHHSDDNDKQWYDWFCIPRWPNLLVLGRDQLLKTTSMVSTFSTATSNLSSSCAYRTIWARLRLRKRKKDPEELEGETKIQTTETPETISISTSRGRGSAINPQRKPSGDGERYTTLSFMIYKPIPPGTMLDNTARPLGKFTL